MRNLLLNMYPFKSANITKAKWSNRSASKSRSVIFSCDFNSASFLILLLLKVSGNFTNTIQRMEICCLVGLFGIEQEQSPLQEYFVWTTLAWIGFVKAEVVEVYFEATLNELGGLITRIDRSRGVIKFPILYFFLF